MSYLDTLQGRADDADVELDHLAEENAREEAAERRRADREARHPEPPPYDDRDPERGLQMEIAERDAKIWGAARTKGGLPTYKAPRVVVPQPEPVKQQAFQAPSSRSLADEMGLPTLEELDNPRKLSKAELDASMHQTRMGCNAEYRNDWLARHPEDGGSP